MPEPRDLYGFAQALVSEAAAYLASLDREDGSVVVDELLGGRETKFGADIALNQFFLERLGPTGLPVLSEESARPPEDDLAGAHWILDPLDGSVNFARGSGPCGISLALWDGSEPVLGVVYRIDTGELYAGGPHFPSTRDGRPITVSQVETQSKATLATGIPARLDLTALDDPASVLGDWAGFAKVRMLGSASVSLCLVARGAVDAYLEQNIMLWDVAAGFAIVLGAGGIGSIVGDVREPVTVSATNGPGSHWPRHGR